MGEFEKMIRKTDEQKHWDTSMYMKWIADGKNRVVVTLVPPLQLPTMWENCGQKSGGRGGKANADALSADGLLDDFWNCYVVDLLLLSNLFLVLLSQAFSSSHSSRTYPSCRPHKFRPASCMAQKTSAL
jgi:hypothetical protein